MSILLTMTDIMGARLVLLSARMQLETKLQQNAYITMIEILDDAINDLKLVNRMKPGDKDRNNRSTDAILMALTMPICPLIDECIDALNSNREYNVTPADLGVLTHIITMINETTIVKIAPQYTH